jgi:hypothetical protein
MSAVDRLKQSSHRAESLLTELKSITRMSSNDELLGAVRGLVETAASADKLRAELDVQRATADESARAQLIAADKANPKGRKLTPALEQLYLEKDDAGKYKRTLADFEAFLKVAPITVQMSAGKQPAVHGGAGPQNHSSDEHDTSAMLKHNGKTLMELKPKERAALYVENREQYDAMLAQHEGRSA